MKKYVFDSYALIAFLEDEPGAETVESALREVVTQKARGYLSIINWGEVFYTVMREQGEETAEEVVRILGRYPFIVVDAGHALTKTAARLKGRYRIAYADCFAAALAIQHNATVLTGDPEFKCLEDQISVSWINCLGMGL